MKPARFHAALAALHSLAALGFFCLRDLSRENLVPWIAAALLLAAGSAARAVTLRR